MAKGKISVTLESECQRCSELFDVNLQIKSQVGIKDITEENLDSKGPYEIHYQDLNCFSIEKLIAEEIHLNFPSRAICCESDNNDKEKENTNNGWWKLQKTDLNVSNDQFGVGNDKTDKDYKADAN